MRKDILRVVAFVETMLDKTPEPLRAQLIKHRELLKFVVVGGICWVITMVVWFGLKWTILTDKPVTAQAIGVIVATICSYVLSREWSFRTRGGRERHHEATLFFIIAGFGVALTVVPTLFSRYVLDLATPAVSLATQEMSDMIFGGIIGTIIQTIFRFWAFRKWVFPHEGQGSRARTGNVSALRPEDSEHVRGKDEVA